MTKPQKKHLRVSQPTQELVRSVLAYNQRTGIFRWKVRNPDKKGWNKKFAGKEAGSIYKRDAPRFYRQISIGGCRYLAHRIAWLYVTGEWPKLGIDHKDQNGLNNKWKNLRLASKSQNGLNCGLSKSNKTGYRGVNVDGKSGRYRATFRGEFLGYRDTAEAAYALRQKAAKVYDQEFAV